MPTGTPHRKSLLLIDDSIEYSALVERTINQVQRGTFVHPVSSGERAIEYLERCGERHPLPDLVLLDHDMPGGLSGMETLRELRKIARLQWLPVLIVSGSDDPGHVEEAREGGADGYIVKPCERDEYLALARAVLAWSTQNSWRSFGGRAAGQVLATREQGIESLTMTTTSAVPPAIIDIGPMHDENGLLRAFHYFRDLVQKTIDPLDFAISEACRKHHIPVAHARGRGQDQVTVANRHAVILDLMDLGYSDRVIEENFQVSSRGIERLRAEWRRKRGGGLTDRPI